MQIKFSPEYVAFALVAASLASGFVFTGTALTGLLLLVWMGHGLLRVVRTRMLDIYPAGVWMLLYLAWMGVSVWWSSIPGASWLAAWVLAGMPIAYLAWGMVAQPEKTWALLRAVLLMAGPAFALWGLGQVVTGYGNGQPVGPLVDKNAYAALMNLFWFMAGVHFIGKMSAGASLLRMILPGVGLLLVSMALFAAESRGATLSWLVLMPFLAWAGYQNTGSRRVIMWLLVIALTGYLGAANLLGLNVAHRTLDMEQDASSSARLSMWKSTVQMAQDHPVVGTGLGTFASHYPGYRDPAENTTSGWYAHNDYLQLAAEGGVPMLLLLLVILVALLRQLLRAMTMKSSPQALEAVGLFLGVMALFMHASLNFIFYFAFMNVLAGLYSARAVQLVNPEGLRRLRLNGLAHIGRLTQGVIAGFVALLVAGPLFLHLVAQLTLTGSQPGLAALRSVSPTVTAYAVADLVTAFRPSSGIAQEFLLSASENALDQSGGMNMEGGDLQLELLHEALDRFELRRSQTNGNPVYGVREASLLIQYRDRIGTGEALARAREILDLNLKKNPFHVDSMIALSRLEVVEGHSQLAQQMLASFTKQVLSRRDQQLLAVELLRQRASPTTVAELDAIEKKLRAIRSDTETGKALTLTANFSDDIDSKLSAIGKALVPKP